ncbi:SDR family oxidoreductase [Pseudomonas atacamensis]|uniref:SDR family oxidoreductase n=1 Tax=Pseudomonas atacamensis TaxID=2565368 RepID=A0AAQ2D7S5_9PSED|nr:SDR family oxidoreductase [Pseudomonas atacamensis]THF25804.1 SDR family oxidoreductase [Pseudomonas atacamensis]
MRLEGKIALITGATSGIGLATAQLFVNEGARVIITGRNESNLAEAKAQIHGPVSTLVADVRSPAQMQSMAQQITEMFGAGTLDIFFANAGVAFSTPLLTTDEAHYDELMDVNVKGLFFSMQAVAPLLRDGASVILNSAWLNATGSAGFSVLSASKAAVRSFARTWSADLLTRRIRVNAVSPGAIDTPIFELEGRSPEQLAEVKRHLAASIPAGRMGTPDDIAQTVLFLAGDESRYMLGAEIIVDGGFAQL